MQAQDVINAAQRLLQDIDGDRWSAADLVEPLHHGRLDLMELRPDIYGVRGNVTLVAGSEQTIPAGGRRFLGPVCNLTAASAQSRAITPVDQDDLDASAPSWRSGTKKAMILHTVFDDNMPPNTFEVYPPAIAGTQVRIRYVVAPVKIEDADLSTELDDEGPYAVALIHYVVFKALIEEQDIPNSRQTAQIHYQLYLQGVGATRRVALMASPNTRERGGTPPVELRTGAAANG